MTSDTTHDPYLQALMQKVNGIEKQMVSQNDLIERLVRLEEGRVASAQATDRAFKAISKLTDQLAAMERFMYKATGALAVLAPAGWMLAERLFGG